MPFTLGIALAVGAWLCADQRRRGWLAAAALLALACVLASPVAGAFLALAAAARAAGGGREALAPAAALALPVVVGGGAMAAAVPRGRRRPLRGHRVLADARRLRSPARRCSRRGAGRCGSARRSTSRCSSPRSSIPTPFGQNALRLPVLLGPGAAPARARAGGAARRVRAVLVALVYLQWLPAVRAVAEAHGDPSTEEAFFAEPARVPEARMQPGERVEVAFTHNHWEAAHLATVVPLARGWERQLDEKANPLFYDGRPLTAGRYHRWLHDSRVRWVALPDAPLDYSAEAEARLLERGASLPAARARVAAAGGSGRCATRRRRPRAARA